MTNHEMCRRYLDLAGWAENFYTVASKIRTLIYGKLPILPINLGTVC